mmetsp:Transcript_19946/g.43369  ORF Transcript_19946/g.43369 Transcript_19946/m.43369 type:complete len:748 (-) Transcript_19946:200-2443(-)|eukprot:CAMPEP_0168194108 /NCGR_PEP_ID=MMETSP0139_2-20121125/18999_1 /TAXON_ID=44445 /ORGANISM="Pseudo-nitzschia australis, Strain 10249 10 AB" /LENGTH=747 /DNA_ID=CAMNT_0008117579 /DNA_START=56 /DNA_END=2299 /DNA_ORIENTATION=-
MGPQDMYLIAYNLSCCVGWSLILLAAVRSLANGIGQDGLKESLANVYGNGVGDLLFITQSAALLEIVHATLGLVRSPVVVTAMQVMSRIVALVAVTYSPNASTQWGAGVMIISWSCVEIFRYLFYAFALVSGDSMKKTPYPLFWLRYSLFAVLYPTGITGELTCFLGAAYDPVFHSMFSAEAAIWFYARILPVVYVLGSPFMILNMVGNRKSSFKKRFARAPPPPRGIVFPLEEGKTTRSSTPVNKEILASAVGAVNPTKAEKIRSAKGYRFTYVKHLTGLVEEQCKSPEACLKIAQAGLDKAYDIFQFVAPDGSSVSVREAMNTKSTEKFSTGFIQGEGAKGDGVMEVPYKGNILKGQALKDQVKAWVDYGTIEPSAGEAMIGCVDNPNWCDLSDKYFVLLGAGSAMGPLLVLLALGANVIAVDLDRPNIWKRLIGLAKKSSGTITFPLKQEQSSLKTDDELYANAGCNLFTHTPMIRDWLMDLYPGKSFTVGSYAYLNGALHVQVSLAMDAITRDLSEKRQGTSLAYLCTPTDLHLVPKEAWDASVANFKEYGSHLLCMLVRLFSASRLLKKNAKDPVAGEGGDFYMINGVSVAQGPNYILAKRMQHWRAVTANSKGCIVSSNIAPATATVSVTQNRTFAWAYEGMPYFKPYEIFAPETSNAVMSAILFSDLNNPKSAGNPKNTLDNPNQLFSHGSFHGGNWRCAYEVDSIGETSVLIYFARIGAPYIAGSAVVVAGVVYKLLGY